MDKFQLSDKNKNSASIEELKFIFSQSECLLKETLQNADNVVNRSFILLGFLLGGITPVIGILFNNFNKILTPINISLIILAVYIAYIIRKIYFNLKGTIYKFTGSQPKDLFHDWYFDNYKIEKDRERQFIIGEIESYQKRITNNSLINDGKWKAFDECMVCSIFIPIVFAVSLITLNLSWQALSSICS